MGVVVVEWRYEGVEDGKEEGAFVYVVESVSEWEEGVKKEGSRRMVHIDGRERRDGAELRHR